MVKKLIICYTQTNKTKLAVSLLKDTIQKNISSIIGSIRNEDDCPCMGLIGQIETGFVVYPDEIEKHTVLGILWLYCDIVTSIQYFKMGLNQEPKNEQINSILQLIETHYQNSNHQFNP
ncbi:MAG: hypothetical protein HYV28_14285 [Ignavibacteriales bacterium]|nr:hypothetical protein [Ignavibacteriales bacterium]